jgi:hypothetical protein
VSSPTDLLPAPTLEREAWEQREIDSYRQHPTETADYAARLQDKVADARKAGGFCPGCDVTWADTDASCWSCNPTDNVEEIP